MEHSELSILEQFNRIAKASDLQYLLIGGFAASFWGEPRFTADVDFVIARKSFKLAQNILQKINYQLIFLHPQKNFAHFDKADHTGFRIDFVLVDDSTWNQLNAERVMADFGGGEHYPVISAKHLIAMKLHAASQVNRQDKFKDLNDVAAIIINQGLSMNKLEKDGILGKYGSDKTITRLKEILAEKSDEK